MGRETKGTFKEDGLDLSLLDRLCIGYYQSDLDGNILAINEAGAAMFGKAPDEMIGKVRTETLNISRAEMDRIRRQVIDLGYASSFIGPTPRADGSVFYMESSLRTRTDQNGEIVGFEGVFRDATAEVELLKEQGALVAGLKGANERLMGLAALQEQLLYALSHDLKTPPVVMQGFSELLLRGRYGPLTPEQEKPLRTVHRNVLVLVEMVENVLIFSRVLKKVNEETGPVSLSALWGEALSELAGGAPETAAPFMPLATLEQDEVRCGRDAVAFLLENISKNVSTLAAPGSRIACEMTSCEDSVTLHIEIERMKADHPSLPRLLDSFFLDSTALEEGPPLGLGLAAARYLAVILGGALAAKLAGEERALFSVTLPR